MPTIRPSPHHSAPWLRGASASGPPEHVTDYSRLLVGLVIVTLGVVYLLDGADVLDASRAIDHWWPVVFLAAGVLTLAERPPSQLRGALFLGIGATLLLFSTDVVGEEGWAYVWPAALIVAGLLIAVRWRGEAPMAASATEGDVIRSTAIFGGPKIVSTEQRLKGAWLTAIFGGATLDLRNARPAAEGATINATVVFGGIDVLVPRGWRLSLRTTPIFGSVEDKTDHAQPPGDDAPTLHVDAVTIFGGVKITHDE